MRPRDVHLHYCFGPDAQSGAELGHPLIELLSALATHGSIQHAALASGRSYRHVWGELRQWEQTLGVSLVIWGRGQPARLTPLAERLLRAESLARARLAPEIEALRAGLAQAIAQALDGAPPALRLAAGHDPVLWRLREHAARDHAVALELQTTGGGLEALRALDEGRCAAAVVHLPDAVTEGEPLVAALRSGLLSGRRVVIPALRRTQGLVVAAGNPLGLRSLADVAARGVRFVAPPPTSGTQRLADWLCGREGIAPSSLAGIGAEPHGGAVAAMVAAGAADAGLASEAEAALHGVGFVPLLEETGFVACESERLDEPALERLCRALQDPAWHTLLRRLPGCTPPPQAGEPIAARQALPACPAAPDGEPVGATRGPLKRGSYPDNPHRGNRDPAR